jgi:hypothetical protein
MPSAPRPAGPSAGPAAAGPGRAGQQPGAPAGAGAPANPGSPAAARPAPQGAPAEGGARFAPIGRAIPRGGPVRARFARGRRGQNLYPPGYYGYGPYYYPDYGYGGSAAQYEESAAEAGPEQVYLQEAPAPPAKPVESLVVERRGDRWVRLTSLGPSETPAPSSNSVSAVKEPSPPPSNSPAAPLPPAVLVFRDGHQEEAARYTIVGKTIHIRTDYWTTGAWTRTVQIADLDLPATFAANNSRGSRFSLPSRPTEVILHQ